MYSSKILSAALSAAVVALASDVSFCTDSQCSNCPVSITTEGTGYPNCVIYNSADIFPGQGFEGNDAGGGTNAYINVQNVDPTCKIIVKSPADTTVQGCGNPIGVFGQPTCALQTIHNSFMVQFCCGTGDCTAAVGSFKRSAKYERDFLDARMPKVIVNGTVINPAKVGPPPELSGRYIAAAEPVVKPAAVVRDEKAPEVKARGGVCDSNSWVPDAGKEDYTRPADGSSLVYSGIAGGQSVQITHERSSSWSTTTEMNAGFSFEDIFSMGVSMSETYSEEVSDSTALSFTAPEGQSGNVYFTAHWACSTGHGTCKGQTLTGEVCAPYKDSTGAIAGQYSVVIVS